MTIDTANRTPGASGSASDATEPPQRINHDANHTIDIALSSQVRRGIDLAWLSDRLGQAAHAVSLATRRPVEAISVRIVSDAEMIVLHRAHKGQASTTDVLSFDSSEGDSHAPIQADILTCADEAVRQSAARGHSVERELLLYALHGLLHCVGYDDLTEQDYRRMHAEEDRILQEIGVGAIFDAGTARSRAAGGDQT